MIATCDDPPRIDPAALYERHFVPALFGSWAAPVAAAAALHSGDRVLDVACGTGVLAREALERVGPSGSVVGLDISAPMLALAERLQPRIHWHRGAAEALDFPDGSFDAVLCQFGLMFFTDKIGALRQMWRVLAPGGRLAVAVWSGLGHAPGFAALIELLRVHVSDAAAQCLRAPFALGDAGQLTALFAAAGLPNVHLETRPGTARFANLEEWIRVEVHAWLPIAGVTVTEERHAALLAAARRELGRYVGPGGALELPISAHIATCTRPRP